MYKIVQKYPSYIVKLLPSHDVSTLFEQPATEAMTACTAFLSRRLISTFKVQVVTHRLVTVFTDSHYWGAVLGIVLFITVLEDDISHFRRGSDM